MASLLFSTELRHLTDGSPAFVTRERLTTFYREKKSPTKGQRKEESGRWTSGERTAVSSHAAPSGIFLVTPPLHPHPQRDCFFPKGGAELARASKSAFCGPAQPASYDAFFFDPSPNFLLLGPWKLSASRANSLLCVWGSVAILWPHGDLSGSRGSTGWESVQRCSYSGPVD